MHLTTTLTTVVLALATSTHAVSNQAVLNNCNETVFLTVIDGAQRTNGPFALNAAGAWSGPINGPGNSLGISKNDLFWSNETAKLILGTTSDTGTLYWTVSEVNGNPVAPPEKFFVGSVGQVENICGNASETGSHVCVFVGLERVGCGLLTPDCRSSLALIRRSRLL
jgi:hypothetical protein